MRVKILRISLVALSAVVLLVIGDVVFNDGLFFKSAVASSMFGVKNSDDQYMSINLDRTRYLESIVITNAYYLQKGAEEYSTWYNRSYPDDFENITLPNNVINPFTVQGGSCCCYVNDNMFPIEGFVSNCKCGFGPESYTIVGAGKNGRIIITLHSSYTSN